MHNRHGHAGPKPSPEYNSWVSMKKRCYYPKTNGYKNYGGRGIKVCDRWLNSFSDFLLDMGPKPSPSHSIDRFPNKLGDYEPSNCRWATQKQQNENKITRSSVLINDDNILISNIEREASVKYNTLVKRINRGWDIKEACNTPKLERIKMGRFSSPLFYIKSDSIFAFLSNLLTVNKTPLAKTTSKGLSKSVLNIKVAKYKARDKILRGVDNPISKKIIGVNTITGQQKVFFGLSEAATFVGGKKSNIANVLSGRLKTYKKWEFKRPSNEGKTNIII